MAFQFRLETILKHRQRLEEVAQREFAEAQQKVDQVLNSINAMYTRLDEARKEIAEAQLLGTREKLAEACALESFVNGQKVRIQNERLRVRELMVLAEEKQERLMEAAREKKVMEKLKQSKKAEFVHEMQLNEAKALDDLTTTRRRWARK